MVIERVAFIGARGHYGYALRGLESRPSVRVVAVSDGAADCPVAPINQWCDDHGHIPAQFTDWRKMLDASAPEALVVCGPFELHAEMSIDAIERGIHVFVEKPAALDFKDLERLRKTLDANPSIHLAGMMGKRFEPGFYTAHQLVRAGAIGDVRIINARKSYKLGTRDAFYSRRETYGGTIPWVGSHAIDWILWISGKPITSIFAAHSADHNDGHGTMERSAVCQFTLTGDAFASASIDLFRPPGAPTHDDDWVRIVGTTGVLEARAKSLSLIDASHTGAEPIPVNCDRQIFCDFLDGIARRRAPLINADQTLALTKACLLARRSADERIVVADQNISYASTANQ